MQIQGQSVLGGASQAAFLQASDNAFVNTELHPRNMREVLAGNVFAASNTAAVTFGTSLTATAVTFTLSNPSGSGKNLVIIKTVLAVAAASTAGSIVYAVNVNQAAAQVIHGTPITAVINCKLGGSINAGNVGLVDSACTLPAAPSALLPFAFVPVTATATTGNIVDYVDGQIVLQPGTAITMQGITAVGTGLFGMVWAEISQNYA